MTKRLLVLACALVGSGSALADFNAIAEQGAALPYTVLGQLDDGKIEIRHGGYGSSAFADPNNDRRFYALTDRGPNADSATKGEKQFLVADYQPAMGLFEVSDQGDITLIKEISLTNPDGQKITGLPNPKGFGATGEQAVDGEGNKLGTDQYGLDGEGLVVLADGICLAHISRGGRQLTLYPPTSPQGPARREIAAMVTAALHRAALNGRLARVKIEEVDGQRVGATDLMDAMRGAGARVSPQGLIIEGSNARG